MVEDTLAADHPSDFEIPGIIVVNTLPWARTVSGRVTRDAIDPRGWHDDPTSTRHHQDRDMDRPLPSAVYHLGEFFGFYNAFGEHENVYLPPTEIPGFGYTVVPTDDLVPEREWPFDERSTVETDRYEITFDRNVGGIGRWYDKELDCEWVAADAEYPLAGFVHEQVADRHDERPRQLLYRIPSDDAVDDPLHPPTGWQSDWHSRRSGATEVEQHRVYETPAGIRVDQQVRAPGVEGPIDLRFVVPEAGDEIVVEATWMMGLDDHPESTYLAFAFELQDPTAYVDVGGQAMEPGREQLPGSCFDHYTAQRWVELTNDDRGMTVGTPINPMVQFGDFHFGDKRETFSLDRALLLGWVTNNYWDTNFRAHQPGRVRARYHLSPHGGSFDEARAHRVGMEAEHWEPLTNAINEEPVPDASLPASGTLLGLPDPPVLTLQVRPEPDEGVFYPAEGGSQGVLRGAGRSASDDSRFTILLRNASDRSRTAVVSSGILTIDAAADVGLLGTSDRSLTVVNGEVRTDLEPRENKRLRFDCRY